MNITIDKSLRELRGKRGNTQEDLAEFLGLSPQAVSRWERGETMPDITYLPQIAEYYNVSVDDLLGVGEIRREEKMQDYYARSRELLNYGRIIDGVALWREAMKEFPNDMRVAKELARFLADTPLPHPEEVSMEIIALCDRILNESTDNALRGSAIQGSCLEYNRMGDKEKAKERAMMAGNIYVTQSNLLKHILDGEEGKRHNQRLLLTYLDLIGSSLKYVCRDEDYEQKLWLHEFFLKIMDFYFDDGFCGFYACRAVSRHQWIAEIYAGCGDEEKTREHIEAALKMAEQFDGLEGEYVYTSTLLNGLKDNRSRIFLTAPITECEELLNWLRIDCFDPYRDRDWFIALEERLKSQNDTNG